MLVEILVGLGGAEPADTYKIFKETLPPRYFIATASTSQKVTGLIPVAGFLKEYE